MNVLNMYIYYKRDLIGLVWLVDSVAVHSLCFVIIDYKISVQLKLDCIGLDGSNKIKLN